MEKMIEAASDLHDLFDAMNGITTLGRSERERLLDMVADRAYPPRRVEREAQSDDAAGTGGWYRWENGSGRRWIAPAAAAQGVRFESLAEITASEPDLAARIIERAGTAQKVALAEALDGFARETIVLYVPRGVRTGGDFLLDAALSEAGRLGAMRVWTLLEDDSEATFTLNLRSGSGSGEILFLNPVTFVVGGNALLKAHEIQDFHENAFCIRDTTMTIGTDGSVDWITAEVGSARSMAELTVNLVGDGAQARINGVFFGNLDQRITMNTRQNHYGRNSYSSLLYKGAVRDQAHATWTGMIYVDPKATGTDGYQKNDNLVLDPEARVFARPGLEIVTNDVKCSHGTTMTEIDRNQVFYLTSRGISEEEARGLIIDGFFGSILDSISSDPIRERIESHIHAKLNRCERTVESR